MGCGKKQGKGKALQASCNALSMISSNTARHRRIESVQRGKVQAKQSQRLSRVTLTAVIVLFILYTPMSKALLSVYRVYPHGVQLTPEGDESHFLQADLGVAVGSLQHAVGTRQLMHQLQHRNQPILTATVADLCNACVSWNGNLRCGSSIAGVVPHEKISEPAWTFCRIFIFGTLREGRLFCLAGSNI